MLGFFGGISDFDTLMGIGGRKREKINFLQSPSVDL